MALKSWSRIEFYNETSVESGSTTSSSAPFSTTTIFPISYAGMVLPALATKAKRQTDR